PRHVRPELRHHLPEQLVLLVGDPQPPDHVLHRARQRIHDIDHPLADLALIDLDNRQVIRDELKLTLRIRSHDTLLTNYLTSRLGYARIAHHDNSECSPARD